MRINGIQAYYQFNEGTGTTTADATGDGYTATVNGATWTRGINGSNGLAFDGSTSYVAVPALNLNTNTVTISGWVKRSGNQTPNAGIVFSRSDLTDSGLSFGGNNDLSYTWDNNPATHGFSSGLVVPDGVWTFVALVVTPTDATLYMQPLGGSMTSATNTVANVIQAFEGTTDIGQDPNGGRFFNGSIDDVRFYNTALNAASIAAVLTETVPVVTTNPANQTITAGNPVTFTTAAIGTPTPTVQWQVSTNGGTTFTNIAGATSTTLSFAAALAQSGNEYQAVLTNLDGSATTSAATLTVSAAQVAPVITTNPASQNGAVGDTTTFTAAASGSPTPTVQWQISADGGTTFTNIPGATSTTLSFAPMLTQNGDLVRAVFTNAAGSATTTAASLTVSKAGRASITGIVFDDRHGTGGRFQGETRLSGVTVSLTTKGTRPTTIFAVTNARGVYTFTKVAAGTYTLTTQPPLGFHQAFPFKHKPHTVKVAAGKAYTGVDFIEIGGIARLGRRRHK